MDNQKVLFYFLIVFLVLLFITTFSNIYNSKINEINEGFTTAAGTTAAATTAAATTAAATTAAATTAAATTAAATTAAGTTQTPTVGSQLSEYVRNYIDSRLDSETEAINRIRDTNSRLENISDRLNMVDESYEKADSISKNYQDFHSDYQEKLEEILKQKFDTDTNQFDVNNRIHAMRLEKIKEDLEYLDTMREGIENEGNDPASPNATPRGQSLRAMSDGSRLNFEHVVVNGERTNKIVVSVNDGCLSYGDPSEMENGRATMSLTLNCAEKYNQPHVHFEIHTINNYTEYNAKINYENDGTKRLVSEDDEISYPFKVVSPTRHFGQCLELQDGNLRIVPCINDMSQRFKISNSQVLGECPVQSS
jgi:F0F1-type ATP synthase membrane subunit b/b'